MKYFSTLLPPPNLTGILHLGHTWNAILQDTLMRNYTNRLGKSNCYWGFGVDHAGISLQIKVEEDLRKQGIHKEHLTEEEFQSKLWEWKSVHEQKITNQYSTLGFLLPLEDKRFTLDNESVEYTVSVFKKLYRSRLIYRAEKLVNWDTKLNTAISDIEIEHKETKTKMYVVKYHYSDDEYISVHTTRPETILGDVCIFVHPDDERYKHLIGKKVQVPMTDRYIEIMADEYIDPKFGSGAMKCTPAHDFNDFALGKKYGLPSIKVFDSEMNILVEPYTGIPKEEAKSLIINALMEKGLLHIEEYVSNIAYSSRSGAIIEPVLSKQWFVKSSTLAKSVLKHWEKHPEELRVTKPSKEEELKKILQNMEDWCISRQLEWGIRIPVYINGDKHSLEPGPGFEASKDVLDTWFSSSLWPCIVFQNHKSLFPLSTLISGKDILLFWISRMLFMCYYSEQVIPFQTVFLHGLVLDSKNRKMSKSLNNGVDPLELINEYSKDAIRLFFLSNTHQDSNITFSKQNLERHGKFIHKLRNAHEFVKRQKESMNKKAKDAELNFNEKQILFLLRELKEKLEQKYDKFAFADIVTLLVDFVWDRFCNQYLELYKILHNHKKNTKGFLISIWDEILNLLDPLIPDFVKECKDKNKSNSIDVWALGEVKRIDWFFEYMNSYTRIRNNLAIPKGERFNVKLFTTSPEKYEYLREYFEYIDHHITYLGNRDDADQKTEDLVFAVYDGTDALLASVEMNTERITKYKAIVEERKSWLNKEIDFLTNRLNGFNEKTPEHMVLEVKNKLDNYTRDINFFKENYAE